MSSTRVVGARSVSAVVQNHPSTSAEQDDGQGKYVVLAWHQSGSSASLVASFAPGSKRVGSDARDKVISFDTSPSGYCLAIASGLIVLGDILEDSTANVVHVYCNNQTLSNVVMWSRGWAANGWRKKSGGVVSYLELVQAFHNAMQRRHVVFHHASAASGHTMMLEQVQRAEAVLRTRSWRTEWPGVPTYTVASTSAVLQRANLPWPRPTSASPGKLVTSGYRLGSSPAEKKRPRESDDEAAATDHRAKRVVRTLGFGEQSASLPATHTAGTGGGGGDGSDGDDGDDQDEGVALQPSPWQGLFPESPVKRACVPTEATHVYTDGACRNNGKPNAVAGIGVWFGPADPRNVSERLPGRQTNQRAELAAIIRALELVSGPIEIYTDSSYSIGVCTRYLATWRRNGFRTSSGAPVKNMDLVRRLDILVSSGRKIKFHHVSGHSGNAGNDQADHLATSACSLPLPGQR